MKFASIGPLIKEVQSRQFPAEWKHNDLIISPKINIYNTSGYIVGMKFSPDEMLTKPRDYIQQEIINTASFLNKEFDVDVVQLGGFTTSVTRGGEVFLNQQTFHGYVTHGDSYTAAVTCQAIERILSLKEKDPSKLTLAIIGAYGIIGEALTKILTPQFNKTYLIGRRIDKLINLQKKIQKKNDAKISTELLTKKADVIITATNHPKTLLSSNLLKKNVIIIDVSQPPNVSRDLCTKRPDIVRIDGGYVHFPFESYIPFMEKDKIFACIAEVIMQALENNKENHVGAIDFNYLKKTEQWGKKYGFILRELTNFGKIL